MSEAEAIFPRRASAYWYLRALPELAWCALTITQRRLRRGRVHPLYTWRVEVMAQFLRRGIDLGLSGPLPEMRTRIPVTVVPRHLSKELTIDDTHRFGGRPAETIAPTNWSSEDPTVLYLHGGGYIACSPASHRELVARIAASAGAKVIGLDYRLAPEHPFPAALEDALAAYDEIRETTSGALFIAGDSAGGGLALATMLRIKERLAAGGSTALPTGAILLSPWVDLTFSGESISTHAAFCYVSQESMEVYRRHYIGVGDPTQPLVSPLFADLTKLPPMLLQVGGCEALYSESLDLADRLNQAEVDVTLQVSEGMFHVFQTLAGFVPTAAKAVDEIGAFVRANASPPSSD